MYIIKGGALPLYLITPLGVHQKQISQRFHKKTPLGFERGFCKSTYCVTLLTLEGTSAMEETSRLSSEVVGTSTLEVTGFSTYKITLAS